MGLEVLQGGFRVGELAMDVADAVTNPYFGGQASAIESTGLVRLAKAADANAFLGLYQNSSFEDGQNGNATVVVPPAYVRMLNGSISQDSPVNGQIVEGAPYDTTISFVPSNLLYIAASGLWSNTGVAGQEKGIVTKGNTSADDAVEAIVWGTNLTAVS
jgi:hypothetical protein